MRLPIMTKNAGKSIAAVAAAAEARRRRMPMVKRDAGFPKRKRTTIFRDSGFIPPPLPPHINNQGRMVYLFYKKLQKSDVGNLSRIVLPKRAVETHLPMLFENGSISLRVVDMDGVGAWSFKFRYWPNNESRMYVFEGTGPFTRKYRLETGDYMLIYKDIVNWNYVIRAVKASEVEVGANKEVTAIEGNNSDNVVLNDSADFGAFDLPGDFANFPNMESIAGESSMSEEIRDILNSFSAWDEIQDFCYPPTPPNVSFDNMSSEDRSQV